MCPHNAYAGDYPVLAEKEVRYIGQEVVAVVAVDEDIAREAVDLVKVDLEERTPVLDPLKAMEPDSPKVSPNGNFVYFGDKPCRQIRKGDFDAAIAQADYVVEGYYRTAAQEHCPIETQVSVCPDGRYGSHPHLDGHRRLSSSTRAHWLTSCRNPNPRCI